MSRFKARCLKVIYPALPDSLTRSHLAEFGPETHLRQESRGCPNATPGPIWHGPLDTAFLSGASECTSKLGQRETEFRQSKNLKEEEEEEEEEEEKKRTRKKKNKKKKKKKKKKKRRRRRGAGRR
ncbi:unnamed protein product [Schistocephalus solidus]|uniref:Uncharacterized protein n=1 Tax=Schistocephalus solidus TaxID=70667 RepID=A0A183TD12_SCHSO|nr:unnamed protein product [Schistocephalus solidus]